MSYFIRPRYLTLFVVLLSVLVSFGFVSRVESVAPFLEPSPASFISQNTAVINANVNPNGASTTAWFDFGTTTNLGQTTSSLAVGDSFTTQSFIGTLSKLAPDTTYYYRVTAQNQFGTQFGSILSFRTTVAIATPTPAPTVSRTPVPSPSATPVITIVEQDITCLILTPSLLPVSPGQGQEVAFGVFYRNGCNTDFTNVILKVALPAEVAFRSANLSYSVETGNNFSFNFGKVTKGFSSTVEIKGLVSDSVNDGGTITFTSVLSLVDRNGKTRSIITNLSDTVGEQGRVAGLADDISNTLNDDGWWWIVFAVLVVVLIFLVYLLISERRRRAESGQHIKIHTPPPPPPQQYFR